MVQLIQSWENPTSATRNEIVFANRNQLYGAYLLRQRYEKTLARAFVFTCSFFTILLLIPAINKLFATSEKAIPIYDDGPVIELPKEIVKPEVIPVLAKSEAALSPSTNRFVVPLVKDISSDDNPPVQDQNNNVNPGLTDHPSDSGLVGDIVPADTTFNIEKPIEISDVQETPMFPGGTSGMMNYLISHIHYPIDAKNSNIHGTVYISFVIDKEGTVNDANIMRGIGGGCDEEALRVVKSMPSWTPGKQNGRAVMVRLVLPVQFSLK